MTKPIHTRIITYLMNIRPHIHVALYPPETPEAAPFSPNRAADILCVTAVRIKLWGCGAEIFRKEFLC